jgi:ribonuclease HI
MKSVTIYTDGACLGNPGPGGYGAVLLYNTHRKEIAAGYRKTTNNRMELLAAIAALEALTEPCQVTLVTDSQYLMRAMTEGWAERWEKLGWRRSKRGAPPANADLWARLLSLCRHHQVTFRWVRSHNGIPENERCDLLARQAAVGDHLLVDEGYEGPHG